ncbi:MAG: hypothetical protein ACOCW9_00075 [Thermodesulfobacteriota bacterium]
MSDFYRLKNLKRVRCIRCGKMVWQDGRSGAILDASSRNRCDHKTIKTGEAEQKRAFLPAPSYPVIDLRN